MNTKRSCDISSWIETDICSGARMINLPPETAPVESSPVSTIELMILIKADSCCQEERGSIWARQETPMSMLELYMAEPSFGTLWGGIFPSIGFEVTPTSTVLPDTRCEFLSGNAVLIQRETSVCRIALINRIEMMSA